MKQEGGSAFPLSIVNFNDYHEPTHTSDTPGMSLRDWFAGMALNGMLSHSLPIKETISADELIVFH